MPTETAEGDGVKIDYSYSSNSRAHQHVDDVRPYSTHTKHYDKRALQSRKFLLPKILDDSCNLLVFHAPVMLVEHIIMRLLDNLCPLFFALFIALSPLFDEIKCK